VEILHRQLESEENDCLQRLKRTAFDVGLDVYCLAIHQGFVSPNPEIRQKNVQHTLRCVETPYQLGAPCIRLNSGRWGTTSGFDELMALNAIELHKLAMMPMMPLNG
jgi:sugar phosphate isomerase/epimerase